MTYLYDFNTRPSSITIRCPKCHSEAEFRFPFTLLRGDPRDQATIRAGYEDSSAKVERWGSWYVLVHFPDIFPWSEASFLSDYQEREWGVSTCSQCGHKGKHKLSWPKDAYFVSNFRGEALWAWTRGHAQALKYFVESKDRNPWNYPGSVLFLLHIPKAFLMAKNREAVSKKLQRMLEL
jgi:hypothetical protein